MFMLQPFSFYLYLSFLPDTKCSGQNTCQDCFSLPGCGWCANTRSTGIGVCMDGTNRGDLNAVCPAQRWYYTKCPSKHCSGQSTRKRAIYFKAPFTLYRIHLVFLTESDITILHCSHYSAPLHSRH